MSADKTDIDLIKSKECKKIGRFITNLTYNIVVKIYNVFSSVFPVLLVHLSQKLSKTSREALPKQKKTLDFCPLK